MSKKIRLGKKTYKSKIDLIGKTVDFPVDPLGRSAHVTLYGNREASVDGCYGIIEYSACLIKINIGNKILCVHGCDFDISDYTGDAMTVRGTRQSLEFC